MACNTKLRLISRCRRCLLSFSWGRCFRPSFSGIVLVRGQQPRKQWWSSSLLNQWFFDQWPFCSSNSSESRGWPINTDRYRFDLLTDDQIKPSCVICLALLSNPGCHYELVETNIFRAWWVSSKYIYSILPVRLIFSYLCDTIFFVSQKQLKSRDAYQNTVFFWQIMLNFLMLWIIIFDR